MGGRERYVHLVYLSFLFMQPAFGSQPWPYWVLAGAVALAFIATFDRLMLNPGHRNARILVVAAFVLSFVNAGASIFYVYAAYMYGMFLPRKRMGAAFLRLVVLSLAQSVLLMMLTQSWFAGLSHVFSTVFVLVAAAVSFGEAGRMAAVRQQKLVSQHIGALATVAERERISRDMHDVLGHTLSVVVLKSELAGRLLERDPARAAAEIASVESLARQALQEVRHAISGYRDSGLAAELAGTHLALEAAGIERQADISEVELPTAAETTLAMVLREAVTNVIRHSGATVCRISLRQLGQAVTLTVSDDGRGGEPREGSGLRGMRERLASQNGSLEISTRDGLTLTATVPAA